MTAKDFVKQASEFRPTPQMPVLFVGHGNPMNAITDNEFVRGWRDVGASLPPAQAVLCISAHWETNGTFVTAMEKPRTIHDFYGFPEELFGVQYPAPGSPVLAGETKKAVKGASVGLDEHWGLDHGCWSVLKHLIPSADVPVVQMSLDYSKEPGWHYELAKELAGLRSRGVLIIGSGNIVHNLRLIDWRKEGAFDWAALANERIKENIAGGTHDKLIDYGSLGTELRMAVPTEEHYLPLLYVLGLQGKDDRVSFFNDKLELGSVSMTCVRIESGRN